MTSPNASFASTEDYCARYGSVSDTAMLQECLDDASAVIRSYLEPTGIDWSDPTDDYADRLMRVCRAMANRVMPSQGGAVDDLPVGATQMSMTAGPYSQSVTFQSPYATPKPLKSELALLGVAGGSYRSIRFSNALEES